VHSDKDDDGYMPFATYVKALKFSYETQGAEEPLVLVLQHEHVNQKEDGTYEHVTGDRITEWRVEWLTQGTKRNENSIREFLKQHGVA
jgi:putative acetyltransferase